MGIILFTDVNNSCVRRGDLFVQSTILDDKSVFVGATQLTVTPPVKCRPCALCTVTTVHIVVITTLFASYVSITVCASHR